MRKYARKKNERMEGGLRRRREGEMLPGVWGGGEIGAKRERGTKW